jgi:hypothetical protein
VTIVRIVLADPRTGRVPEGSAVNGQQLIVLADDAGHRAVPLWLRVIDAKLLWGLLERSAGDAVMAGVLEETAARPVKMCRSCARARPRRGSGWPRPPETGMSG